MLIVQRNSDSAVSRCARLFASGSVSDAERLAARSVDRQPPPVEGGRPRREALATTIEELERRRELARLGGGEKRIQAQHAK